MSENKNIAEVEVKENKKLTVDYVLEQIEKIMADTAHITEALAGLKEIESEMGDITSQAQAIGIETVVKERETTNRELIHFYEKLYEDVKPKNIVTPDEKARSEFMTFVMNTTSSAAAGADGKATLPDFELLWKTVYLGQ